MHEGQPGWPASAEKKSGGGREKQLLKALSSDLPPSLSRPRNAPKQQSDCRLIQMIKQMLSLGYDP